MAFDSKGLDEYVDVPERITEFYKRYPEGSLQPYDPGLAPYQIVQVQGADKNGQDVQQTFIVYVAAAYRTPDDTRPGIGIAWEVFPGRTNFTRGSEVMNAETSAWGRAIAALGIATKKGIASRQEVAARHAERDDAQPANGHRRQSPGADMWDEIRHEERPGSALPADIGGIKRAYIKLGFDPGADREQVANVSGQLVGRDLNGPTKGLTHANLTFHEAKKLRAELEGFKDRGALMGRLTGSEAVAAAVAAQDAAEGSQEELS